MPATRLIPTEKGLTEDQLRQALESGWVFIGRHAINTGVATPKSPGGTKDVDIWMLQEPMIPQRVIMELLIGYSQWQPDAKQYMNDLCVKLFKVGVDELKRKVEELSGVLNGKEEEDQDQGVGEG